MLRRHRHAWRGAVVAGASAVMTVAAAGSSGCALLPQTETETNLALVITGVLIVGSIVAALVVTLRGKK